MMKKLTQEVRSLLDVQLTPWQSQALTRYEDELIKWNTHHNLTAIRDPKQIRVKHFLDSLSAYIAMCGEPMERIVDVGTGAGFPGLPLKILCPNIKLTLIESISKKVIFCQHVVDTLGLEGVEVVNARVEGVGKRKSYREQYDWAIARAVAVMPVLVEYLLPLVKVGGKMLAMKGDSAPAETHSAENAIHLLGGKLRQLLPVTLPGVAEQRYLVIVDKIATTPHKFPRRAGIPAKRPL